MIREVSRPPLIQLHEGFLLVYIVIRDGQEVETRQQHFVEHRIRLYGHAFPCLSRHPGDVLDEGARLQFLHLGKQILHQALHVLKATCLPEEDFTQLPPRSCNRLLISLVASRVRMITMFKRTGRSVDSLSRLFAFCCANSVFAWVRGLMRTGAQVLAGCSTVCAWPFCAIVGATGVLAGCSPWSRGLLRTGVGELSGEPTVPARSPIAPDEATGGLAGGSPLSREAWVRVAFSSLLRSLLAQVRGVDSSAATTAGRGRVAPTGDCRLTDRAGTGATTA